MFLNGVFSVQVSNFCRRFLPAEEEEHLWKYEMLFRESAQIVWNLWGLAGMTRSCDKYFH
jgi:hypothetical protein